MSVQITIPLEKIESGAGVAAALTALMTALHAKPSPRTPTKSQPPAPARSAPVAKPAVARAAAAPPASVTTSPSQPTSLQAKATKRAPRAVAAPAGPATFSAGGPGPKLVALLRERGSLTAAAVAKELGIKDPKAIGGVVGSMNRWAGKKSGAVRIDVKEGAGGKKTYSLAK